MSGSHVTLPAPDLPPGPRSALVIATTTYADPTLRALRAPATDARDFAAVLADPQIGGFDVVPVIDRPAQDIRIAVEGFLSQRAPQDFVVMYVSCHGVTDARNRLYFTATDTLKTHLGATGVESGWVMELVRDCRARSRVVVLDCCFSGAFAHGAKGELDLTQRMQARGLAVLTASRANEYSFEAGGSGDVVEDGAGSGSVFTSALLDGLRTGAADRAGTGHITVEDAYLHAERQVRAGGAAQTPQRWLSGGEGALVLARNPRGVPLAPAALPESLRHALDNPRPAIRLAAVTELEEWLTGPDRAQALAAAQILREAADHDVPVVAAAARELLSRVAEPVTSGTPVRPRLRPRLPTRPGCRPPRRRPTGPLARRPRLRRPRAELRQASPG